MALDQVLWKSFYIFFLLSTTCIINKLTTGFYTSNLDLSLKITSTGFGFFVTEGNFVSSARRIDALLKPPSVTIISKFSWILSCKRSVAKRNFCNAKLSTLPPFTTSFMAGFSRWATYGCFSKFWRRSKCNSPHLDFIWSIFLNFLCHQPSVLVFFLKFFSINFRSADAIFFFFFLQFLLWCRPLFPYCCRFFQRGNLFFSSVSSTLFWVDDVSLHFTRFWL